MPPVGPLRSHSTSRAMPGRGWRTLSLVATGVSIVLSIVVFGANLLRLEVSPPLIFLVLIAAVSVVIFVHGRFLMHLEGEHRQTSSALVTTEHDLRQMADNIQEVFWMLDAKTKKVVRVNRAYETITGRSCQSLEQDPSSYKEAIHPEDRSH